MSLSKAVRHTGIQFAGRAVATLFGVLALAVLTRYLGKEKFGWYTTITVYLQFFGILADFGFTLITAQMLGEKDADESKILSNIFSLRLLISGAFFGAGLILIWFLPYPAIIKTGAAIFVLSLFSVTLQNIFVGFYQKRMNMDKVALGDILGRGLILIGFSAAFYWRLNFYFILWASVFANLIQLVLLFYFSRSLVKLHLERDWLLWKKILWRSAPVAISIAFNLIYLKADTLILSFVRTQEEVGLYGAAYRVIDVLTSIPIMFMGILLPLLALSLTNNDKEKFQHYLSRAFDFMAMLILPILLGGFLLSNRVMIFVAGTEFYESGNYLRILLLAVTAIFFNVIFSHAILALNMQRKIIRWYLADAILSLAGYIFLIPRLGAYAAAGVTVFSEVFIMFAAYILARKTSGAFLSWKIFNKSLAAAVIMSFVIYFLRGMNLLPLLAMSALVYFVVLYLLKGLTKEMFLSVFKDY